MIIMILLAFMVKENRMRNESEILYQYLIALAIKMLLW